LEVLWALLLLLLTVLELSAAEIRGRVIDATTREPIAKVSVREGEGIQVLSDSDGRFSLSIDAGKLQFSSVGYKPLQVDVSSNQELEVSLVPDTLSRTERLDVSSGPFGVEAPGSVSLAGAELRNLASVLADDPLRAVHGLPGVNSNDDFSSQISLRGAGFQRVGIYVDGVLLHSPYHTLQADPASASLTVLSSDLLERAELHPGPIPVNLSDRTAAAVDLRVREGDRKKFNGRAAASFSNASLTLEGPLGGKRRGSWLIGARKSYLQYLIGRSTDDNNLAFGFWDVQGRVAYDVMPTHTVWLSMMHGNSGLDRSGATNLGLNSFFNSNYTFTVGTAGSRWTVGRALVLNSSGSWMREQYLNINRDADPLAFGHYGEWIGNFDNTWQWGERATLLFGGVVRRLRDFGYLDRRSTVPPLAVRQDEYRGTALRGGAHLAQQFTLWTGKLWLRAGGRWDSHSVSAAQGLSPSASVTLNVVPRGQLHLAWGQAVQYPELSQLYSRFGRTTLLPERSSTTSIAWEQKIDDRTRVRAEVYERLDRDLIFRPLYEPRILDGRVYGGNLAAPVTNSLRGYGRGMQVFLQRRTANGLTGWASYSYGVARLRNGPSDFDQRHTANIYLSYRLRPTVNLSGRWTYGGGFPLRGFYQGTEAAFFLSTQRNQLNMPAYHRMDFRANKTFIRRGWHITLFAEVVNLYNHENVRFDDARGIDARTGSVRLGFDRLFPILPSAGLSIDF
jgi:hypothetical protein